MSLRRFACVFAWSAAALLTGCAVPVQQPVNLSDGYFAQKANSGRVGVVVTELPKPDTEFPGAGCLLCIGVANAAHSSLTSQVRTFTTDELKPLSGELASLLKKRGMDVVVIDDLVKYKDLPDFEANGAPNKSRKNLSALKSKHQVDRILLVHFDAAGVWRAYSAYVPIDVPKAVLKGHAAIIDLSSHSLDWYLPLDVARAADGAWDEPPKFPGLTNAYYQALEAGMDQIKKPLGP